MYFKIGSQLQRIIIHVIILDYYYIPHLKRLNWIVCVSFKVDQLHWTMEWNFCRLSAPTYLLSVPGSSQVSFSCALGKLLLLRTDNGHPKNVLSGIFCTKWKIFLTQKWMFVPVLLSGGEGGFFKHTSKTKYRNPTRLELTMLNPQPPEVHLNPILGLLTSQSSQ